MTIHRAILTLILLHVCISALEIQRDLQSEFIFSDKVTALSELPCKDGVLFMPENSSYYGGEEALGIPFRTYTIALPNSSLPSVDVENIETKSLSGKPCGAEQTPSSIRLGKPHLQDNLWKVKVNVPLLYSNGNSWVLRKNFRVRINFSGSANGYSIGKRALHSVENKNAAARFGAKRITSLVAKKENLMNNIDWLLRIGIGSTDLSATADGMYALSFDDLRSKMRSAGRESEMDGIRIAQLRLFGASPDTLPEYMTENEIFPNAEEIPIQVKDKNSNGIFDSGDSITFFGYGTAIWKKSGSASGMDYYFSNSPYSFYQYFYLGAGGTGKRLESKTKTITGARDIVWKKYARSEKDLLLRDNYFGDYSIEENTGKEWFWAWGVKGEVVTVQPNEFQSSVRNLSGLASDSVWIGVSFFPRRSVRYNGERISELPLKNRMDSMKFDFYFQDRKLQNIIDTIFGGGTGTFVFAASNASTNNSYKLDFESRAGNRSIDVLSQNDRFDGLSIAYKYNAMQSAGDEWLFPGTETGAIEIPVSANMELIKIENFIPAEILEGTSDTISGKADTRYFLHKKGSYKIPAIIEAIPNRAVYVSEPLGISSATEYLILTSEILQSSAVNLKQFRENGEAPIRLNTAVVLIEDIYRNHGGQASPVAIRDYIRYAKNICPDLRYVLLAGNGNYDYRKIRSGAKSNLLPPYEAEDMSTDDFFAVLDSGEAVRFKNYKLALAVGRLPVSNAVEFESYVQKAKDYENVSLMDNGIWRNTIIFSTDDAMQGSNIDIVANHTLDMEKTIANVDKFSRDKNFAINWRKISMLQYEKDGNNKKPDATRELLLRLNQGALFSFYYGHGNAVMWADEDLLNTSSLNNISNTGRYTILGSFSCLVARFDDAAVTSLSEVFVTAKSKGAIASIGSIRESFASPNRLISEKILLRSLSKNILLGDAIKEAKQTVSDSYSFERYNNEKYVLLGEPVLSMPRQEISLNLDGIPDNTIQALQKLKISGTASAQAGSIRMQVLEGEKSRVLNQKNCDSVMFCSAKVNMPGNPIYSEELQINDGKFSTEFITPRKLSFGDTAAQIRLWSYKPNSAEIGRSLISGISLSGTSSYADSIQDNTAPAIKIYPCMRSGIAAPYAENAHISLEIPACLDVVIEDSTGIDYREEAGEGISFEVSPVEYSWHPWSFSEQTGKRAVARMNFGTSYDAGEYVFKVNAQDILGNIAFRSLRVSLNTELKNGLADVFNIPNPMKKNGTVFYFKDLSGERLSNVTIKIFDQNGKLVKTINNAISGVTRWDGRDSRGRMLANGLYHYVVQNTVQGKKTYEKKQKLVISR
ncbi:MAG: C25 family cysteine peptidase [Fibromonadales bacterium]|nr:C25 family cysteine peptidase [Fibromonadales bacterium]